VVCAAHLFVLSNDGHEGLELAAVKPAVRNGPNFLSVMRNGEAFQGLGVHCVKGLISLVLYFHLMK
jgi:hypothetical protein